MNLCKALSAIASLIMVAASAEAKPKLQREEQHQLSNQDSLVSQGGFDDKKLECWKDPKGCANSIVVKSPALDRQLEEEEPMENIPNSAYLATSVAFRGIADFYLIRNANS